MKVLLLVDVVWFWLKARIKVGARDIVRAWAHLGRRAHPHIAYRSTFNPFVNGAVIECCECWCGCRCYVLISPHTPLPVELPRSSEWQMPPAGGWTTPIP